MWCFNSLLCTVPSVFSLFLGVRTCRTHTVNVVKQRRWKSQEAIRTMMKTHEGLMKKREKFNVTGSYSRTNTIFLSIQFLSIVPNVPLNFMKQYKTLLTCCYLSYISDTWFPIETQPCFNKWRERKRKWKKCVL